MEKHQTNINKNIWWIKLVAISIIVLTNFTDGNWARVQQSVTFNFPKWALGRGWLPRRLSYAWMLFIAVLLKSFFEKANTPRYKRFRLEGKSIPIIASSRLRFLYSALEPLLTPYSLYKENHFLFILFVWFNIISSLSLSVRQN